MKCPRILLVGQAPSRNGDPDRPLIGGRSGRRIQDLCGLSLLGYARTFVRLNVIREWPGALGPKGDDFPMAEARERAVSLASKWSGRRAILLGRKVAGAFGHPDAPFFEWSDHAVGFRFALCPHPSAVNLFWNEPSNVARARVFFRSIMSGEKTPGEMLDALAFDYPNRDALQRAISDEVVRCGCVVRRMEAVRNLYERHYGR